MFRRGGVWEQGKRLSPVPDKSCTVKLRSLRMCRVARHASRASAAPLKFDRTAIALPTGDLPILPPTCGSSFSCALRHQPLGRPAAANRRSPIPRCPHRRTRQRDSSGRDTVGVVLPKHFTSPPPFPISMLPSARWKTMFSNMPGAEVNIELVGTGLA